jgi:NodT family efflux transporter outer membrane factor (OMF) lipoprotein
VTLRRVACLLLLTAGLSSCAVGPDYKAPTPPEGATAPIVPADAALETTAEPPDAWWRLYDDSAFDALIREAFANNDDIKAAEANLAAARAVLEGARAGLFPQTNINLAGVYGRDPTTDEILEIGGHKPATTWLFDDLLDVSYELDLFGHVRRSIEAAQAGAEATAAQRDAVKVTVAAETARAYAQLCTVGEEIAVAHHSLELVSREAEITDHRRIAGAGSDFEVVRAQGLVEQTRSTIPPLEGQRRAALFELTAILGRTPANLPPGVDGCVHPPRLTALLPVGDGAALLKRRPDIRAADRHLASAIAEIGVATAELYPRITLSGFFGGVSSSIDQLGTAKALAWGVGPAMNWNFPVQAGPRARVRQSKAEAVAALSDFDKAVLQALKETAQALSTYTAELDHHAALVAFQDKARRTYELAHGQFAAGALSSLDLLTSEQALVAADAGVAVSDTAIVQDQIAVFKALGGGWRSEPDIAPDHGSSR